MRPILIVLEMTKLNSGVASVVTASPSRIHGVFGTGWIRSEFGIALDLGARYKFAESLVHGVPVLHLVLLTTIRGGIALGTIEQIVGGATNGAARAGSRAACGGVAGAGRGHADTGCLSGQVRAAGWSFLFGALLCALFANY
jgi:hypothetical protein